MSTVVTVMDRDGWEANTDVIVAVLPRRRLLLWVPRDLWSSRYRCRVNGVFAGHGHQGLLRALRELGVRAQHSVCLQRGVVEAAVTDLELRVPVAHDRPYLYPLTPTTLVQDGAREISFTPPAETLSGERIHMWLGARKGVGWYAGDLERLGRQQTFLRALLRSGEDVGERASRRPELISRSGQAADLDLQRVGAAWRMRTLDNVAPGLAEGREVLVRRTAPGPLGRIGLKRRAARLGVTLT